MKKYILALAIVILLIVLPLGSWYYLNSGLDYRKQSLVELAVKVKVDSTLAIKLNLTKKTTVIHRYHFGNSDLISRIGVLIDQFEDNESFQFISILRDTELYDAEDSVKWKITSFADSLGYMDLFFKNDFTLIDTDLNVRNYYNSDDSSFTKLIEHIAIVLPRKKDLDIELRRQKEK